MRTRRGVGERVDENRTNRMLHCEIYYARHLGLGSAMEETILAGER